jgi:glyoxylate reductase
LRVFVSNLIPDEILGPLFEICDVDIWPLPEPTPRGELLARVSRCQGLLSMLSDAIDRELLDLAPDLWVISQMSAGVDNIDLEACRARGVVVGHTPDVLTETVADSAFALMLAVMRRIPEGADRVKDGVWGPWNPWDFLGTDVYGKVMGIVGMGRIGHAIARRAAGFDMPVLYSSPSEKDVPGAIWMPLTDLLPSADVVMLAAPLSESTRGMIGPEELTLMKDGSYLVNVARGPLVQTGALVDALLSREIGGAALDVTDPEPLPAGHPLLGLFNCLVVPHIGSASLDARRGMARLAVENLVAAVEGSPMPAWHSDSAPQPSI